MLLLLGRNNSPINFTIFDIGHHSYTKPCLEYIKSKFTHISFEYVEGDSTITMPEWINNHKELIYKYDVVHVDGGHDEHCISNDMKNADLLVKPNGIVIVDDTNSHIINSYVDLYLSNGNYIELNLLYTHGYPHRIIKKIK
jgi:3D (Asp-Asp-Asp) domain-containing protein